METEASKNVPLSERGITAAEKFLARRGYEIIERSWKCEAGTIDLVVKENNYLCFVIVQTQNGLFRGFDEKITKQLRMKLETLAFSYLKEKPDMANCRIRFDEIKLQVVSDDRAMLQHHIDFLSGKNEYDSKTLRKAERCLVDNGIAPDEAQTVLQALGYILLNKDLYLA